MAAAAVRTLILIMSESNHDSADEESHYGDEEFDEDQSDSSGSVDSAGSLSDPDDNERGSPGDSDEDQSDEDDTEDDEDDENEDDGDNEALGGTLATYLGLLKDAEASDEYQIILNNSMCSVGNGKSKLFSADDPKKKHIKKSRIDGLFPDDQHLLELCSEDCRESDDSDHSHEEPKYSDILGLLVIPESNDDHNENKKDESMTWSPAKNKNDDDENEDSVEEAGVAERNMSDILNPIDLPEKEDKNIVTTPRKQNVKKETLKSTTTEISNEIQIGDIKQQIERLKKLQLLSKAPSKSKMKEKPVVWDLLASEGEEENDAHGGQHDSPRGYGNKIIGRIEIMPNPDWEELDGAVYDRNKKEKSNRKSKRGNKINSRRNSLNNDNNNFDADERHKAKLAEMASRKKVEDERKENDLEKASARRKRFKEALLEKALRSRVMAGDSVEYSPVKNVPSDDVQKESRSDSKSLGLIGKKGAPALKYVETDEQRKSEEDRLIQIAVLRKKFKEQHKIIIRGLVNKKREAEKKIETELKNEEEKKRRWKIKGELLLAKRTESISGQPLSAFNRETGSEGRARGGKALNLKKYGDDSDRDGVDNSDTEGEVEEMKMKRKRNGADQSTRLIPISTSVPTSASTSAPSARRGSLGSNSNRNGNGNGNGNGGVAVAVGSGLASVRAHRSRSAEAHASQNHHNRR